MYSMADSLPPNNTIDLTKPQLITKDVTDSLRDSLNNDMFGSNEDKTDYSIVSKKKIADTAKNLVTNYLPLSLLKKSGNEDNEKAIKARIEQQIAKLKKDGKYDTNYNYDTQEYNGKKLRYLGKCESIKLIRDGNDLNSNQNYQNDNNDIPEDTQNLKITHQINVSSFDISNILQRSMIESNLNTQVVTTDITVKGN